ncbi:hypothetical protein [Microcoleus sp. CAWBG58]|uniref:hypothetical protein n=1 Tax=Microcoleus sp. CAWBG58 TaxID=2841651 RepID=UPI0025F8DBDC|nr:hypothetical protein [Microcoleus sp. CAWBG58]
MFPFQKPAPTIEVIPAKISTSLKALQGLSDWHFRGIFLSIGVIATNVIRSLPQYLTLYFIVGAISIIWMLFVPPSQPSSQGLYRTGATALFLGSIAWWDLLHYIPLWWFGIAIVGLILLLAAVGESDV